MPEASPRRAPDEIFKGAVEHYPMVSINIVLEHARLGYLWVLRKNEPSQGEWWVPGGRLMNGETLVEAAHAVLRSETGLTAELVGVAPSPQEEIFHTKDFRGDEWKTRYNPATKRVHYLGFAAYMKLYTEPQVRLDDQSQEYRWSKELLSEDPLLRGYFAMTRYLRDEGH